jgi:CxxC-x17-CxxC domain-containing protein
MRQEIVTEVICSDCGKSTKVPFKPTAGKPVYCQECLIKHRPPRRPDPKNNREQTKPQAMENEKQAWSRRRGNWK